MDAKYMFAYTPYQLHFWRIEISGIRRSLLHIPRKHVRVPEEAKGLDVSTCPPQVFNTRSKLPSSAIRSWKHTKHGFGILESEMQDKPKRSVLQIWGCQQQLGWLLRALLDAAESSDKTWVPKCSHINTDTSIVRSKMRDRDLLRSLFHYFITDFLMFISVLRSVETYCDLLNWLTVFFGSILMQFGRGTRIRLLPNRARKAGNQPWSLAGHVDEKGPETWSNQKKFFTLSSCHPHVTQSWSACQNMFESVFSFCESSRI